MGPAFEARRDEAEGTPIGLAAAGHLRALAALLSRVDLESLERVINRLRVARDAGATVFVAGNGGSAATASHWVNDLCKATRCAESPPDPGHLPVRQHLMAHRARQRRGL